MAPMLKQPPGYVTVALYPAKVLFMLLMTDPDIVVQSKGHSHPGHSQIIACCCMDQQLSSFWMTTEYCQSSRRPTLNQMQPTRGQPCVMLSVTPI